MKQKNDDFDYIKINLASPERIRMWAERILPNGEIIGEVTSPETLNYRTFKPEFGGLFCEKIFGPMKDWECHCGKHKQVRHQGMCNNCNVDLTEARVRRYRMGYIDLKTPVTHVWYLKGVPSYMAHVLEEPRRRLEETVYYHASFQGDPFEEVEKEKALANLNSSDQGLTRLDKIISIFGNSEVPKVGGEVLLDELKKVNLKESIAGNREFIKTSKNKSKVKTAIRRIRIFESFLSTNSKPEWMVLKVLPVIPPGLRPMVQLEGGRFASSDLNELYRRVVIRNNRLGRLVSLSAPSTVICAEKKLVQEGVDDLIDNGKRGTKALDINKRPLKSLADTVEGKYGRFRFNLLGKRVDYSGRSVIVVGPSLELNQCGLPYEMAIELFSPYIVHELIKIGLATTIRSAKKIIYSNEPFLWNLVKKIIQKHPVLLNRAPTLHRLGVQAFEPVLVKGRAIQLHPLVCPAFNADFDGDQMAVHIPLSLEAQTEARILMLAPNNFLSPATGEPIIQPTQDMLLGCYYLTLDNRPNLKGANQYFGSFEEVIFAYNQKQIALHASLWVRCLENYKLFDNFLLLKEVSLNDESKLKIYKDLQVRTSKNGKVIVQYIRTTPGRILFNQSLNNVLMME